MLNDRKIIFLFPKQLSFTDLMFQDRNRVVAETPLHDDISLIDEEVQNKPNVSRPESPNHAWYNQEKLLDKHANKDGESNGNEDNSLSDREMPGISIL